MKEVTKRRWKKFGYFWLSWVPTITYLMISTVVALGIAVLIGVKGMMEGVEDIATYVMDGTLDSAMASGVLYAILGILAIGCWYYFGCKQKGIKPPQQVMNPLNLVIIAVLAFCMQFVVSYLVSFVALIMPEALENYNELIEVAGVGEVTFAGILYGVILGPIAEELTFRGLTLYFARKFTKRFWIANIVQAIFFGVFHMNLIQGIYAFALGLVMGWIYKRYKSLYASIWFHIVFNFLAFGPLEWITKWMPETDIFYIIWAIVTCGVSIVLIQMIRNRTAEKQVQ